MFKYSLLRIRTRTTKVRPFCSVPMVPVQIHSVRLACEIIDIPEFIESSIIQFHHRYMYPQTVLFIFTWFHLSINENIHGIFFYSMLLFIFYHSYLFYYSYLDFSPFALFHPAHPPLPQPVHTVGHVCGSFVYVLCLVPSPPFPLPLPFWQLSVYSVFPCPWFCFAQ